MTYTFEEQEGRVLIYNARRKLVGSVRRDADGALVVEYGENVMWLPIRDALERLDGAKAVNSAVKGTR